MNKTQSAQNAINKAMAIHPEVFYAGRNEQRDIRVWLVAGEKNDYAVYEQAGEMHCTCQAGERGTVCYHRAAVLLNKLQRDAGAAFCKALDASIAEREAYEAAQIAPATRETAPLYRSEAAFSMFADTTNERAAMQARWAKAAKNVA